MKASSLSLACMLAAAAGGAAATTTGVTAAARAQGHPDIVQSQSAGAAGTSAAAAQTWPGNSNGSGASATSSQGSAFVGTLSAAGDVQGRAAGDLEARTNTLWSDSFVITAAGHGAQETGTFSGSVVVTGSLNYAFSGRAYVGGSVDATIDIFPDTGYNGGRTVASNAGSGGAGYDIVGGTSGSPSFVLWFTDVPFTFGRAISFTLTLNADASTRLLDGMPGLITDGVAHSITAASASWGGLSAVHDGSGGLIADFQATGSGSAFDFAHAAPVPEPSAAALLAAGLLVVGRRLRRAPAHA